MQIAGCAWDLVTAATIKSFWIHTGIIGSAAFQLPDLSANGIQQQFISKYFDLNLANGAVDHQLKQLGNCPGYRG